jgi:gentisate 1,2-dioxygenase
MSMAVSDERSERIAALNERSKAANLRGAWHREGRPQAEPVRPWVWHWNDVLPCLLEAGEIVPIDNVMRMRTIGMRNPTQPGTLTTTPTLTLTMQHLGPGEITESHRHTRTSLYFFVQGQNTTTIAEGEQQPMEPGDLLIQPSWTWHGTTNTGPDPSIWLTIQDTGLINTFDVEFRGSYSGGGVQPATKPEGYYRNRLGLYNTSAALETEGAFYPIKYPWKDTLAMLEALAEAEESDPCDGVVLDYKNPLTGGPATLTMGARIQMLRPGEETQPHRHTGHAIYHVVRGAGQARVGSDGDVQSLDLAERDCFSLPTWEWHRLRNTSNNEPLILFSVNDHPLLEITKLSREERG